MELAGLDYDLVHFAPSLIAAAAFAASLRILGSGQWVRRFFHNEIFHPFAFVCELKPLLNLLLCACYSDISLPGCVKCCAKHVSEH